MKEKIKKYLEWKGTYALRASVNYKIWLDRFIKICGSKTIEKYTIADFIKYRTWVESHYSAYCVQYSTVVVKNFFKFYRDQDIKCISPSFIKIPHVHAHSHRAISEVEYNRTISLIPSNDFCSLRDLLVIRLLWDTGVRVSELCDLNISHINENSQSCVIYSKKSGTPRIIVWSPETHWLLTKYLAIRMDMNKVTHTSALFLGRSPDNKWSQRLTNRSVQRIIKGRVSKAGINEKITPHSFRHGWAHIRRDQNAPLAFIQRGLGHISPVSTFIYEQYNDNEFIKNANGYFKTV